ncbi:MAG TPA: hypothetical protein VNZ01_10410 [Solirubrobacteraceae bacterium]|jgi:hypothetical protein|nr:hypothetical protein [Solirubrobacteraceae bacterium]
MKRILLVAVSSSSLALGAPAVASAHHHAKHHHAKHHHAARARVLDFRASAPATPATPGSPATPATPSTESVGTVTSFKEGVLIITLTDGTAVSGKVTEQTEIHCTPATPPTGGDDDEGGSGEGDQGTSSEGDEGSHGDAHAASSGDDGEDGPDDGQQSCTTAALVPGAMAREAELTLGSTGAVWDRIDLIQ